MSATNVVDIVFQCQTQGLDSVRIMASQLTQMTQVANELAKGMTSVANGQQFALGSMGKLTLAAQDTNQSLLALAASSSVLQRAVADNLGQSMAQAAMRASGSSANTTSQVNNGVPAQQAAPAGPPAQGNGNLAPFLAKSGEMGKPFDDLAQQHPGWSQQQVQEYLAVEQQVDELSKKQFASAQAAQLVQEKVDSETDSWGKFYNLARQVYDALPTELPIDPVKLVDIGKGVLEFENSFHTPAIAQHNVEIERLTATYALLQEQIAKLQEQSENGQPLYDAEKKHILEQAQALQFYASVNSSLLQQKLAISDTSGLTASPSAAPEQTPASAKNAELYDSFKAAVVQLGDKIDLIQGMPTSVAPPLEQPPAPATPTPAAPTGQAPVDSKLIALPDTTGNVVKDDSPGAEELHNLAQQFQSWLANQPAQALAPAAPAPPAPDQSGNGSGPVFGSGKGLPWETEQQPPPLQPQFLAQQAQAAPAAPPAEASAGATDPMQQFLVTGDQTPEAGGLSTGDLQAQAATLESMQSLQKAVDQTNATYGEFEQKIDDTKKAMDAGTLSTEDGEKAIAAYQVSVHEAIVKALPELQGLLHVLQAIGKEHPRLNLDTSGLQSAIQNLQSTAGTGGAGAPGDATGQPTGGGAPAGQTGQSVAGGVQTGAAAVQTIIACAAVLPEVFGARFGVHLIGLFNGLAESIRSNEWGAHPKASSSRSANHHVKETTGNRRVEYLPESKRAQQRKRTGAEKSDSGPSVEQPGRSQKTTPALGAFFRLSRNIHTAIWTLHESHMNSMQTYFIHPV